MAASRIPLRHASAWLVLARIALVGVALAGVARAGVARARTPAPSSALAAEPVRYSLGLLERGPAWTSERSARTDSIQAGHMANMVRMANAGALLAAGPFAGGGELRGVFVFAPAATGLDSLLAGDPALASGRLVCRLQPWLAPPGLGADYRRRAAASAHSRDAPADSMVTYGWVLLNRGPRHDSHPTPAVRQLLARHREYTERMRADGTLVFAGSIEGTGELDGVLVMQGDSATVAGAVQADPAVRAGHWTPRILRWWTAWGTIPGH